MRFEDKKINDFTEILASDDAVPGGGGASALVGAVGMALGNMVGALTVGKKKYADVEDDIRGLMKEGEELRKELLAMMDKDAEAFAPLIAAYRLPKDDPSADKIMEKALISAAAVPMDIMHTVCRTLELLKSFAVKGSAIAISDAGVGAVCCKAALQGAAFNVYINTKSMKDRKYAARLEDEADSMLEKYCKMADEVYETVLGRIRQSSSL